MGLGRCQYKPDRRRKTRKKGEDGEEAPKVDMLRQKVDAAFFRTRYLPDDGRPHWADQGVPVEFKGGKQGVAVDPFEGKQEGPEDEEQEAEEAEAEEQEEDETDGCG